VTAGGPLPNLAHFPSDPLDDAVRENVKLVVEHGGTHCMKAAGRMSSHF
jgi:hypothetical protein